MSGRTQWSQKRYCACHLDVGVRQETQRSGIQLEKDWRKELRWNGFELVMIEKASHPQICFFVLFLFIFHFHLTNKNTKCCIPISDNYVKFKYIQLSTTQTFKANYNEILLIRSGEQMSVNKEKKTVFLFFFPTVYIFMRSYHRKWNNTFLHLPFYKP